MSNILTIPSSASIYFDQNTAGSSTVPNLTSQAVVLKYDGVGGINITSYDEDLSASDRFSVDGYNGRLFSVSDALTGDIFSINDAAGLPIINVYSDSVADIVNIGTFGTDALVVNDTKVGVGTDTPNEKLTVNGNISATGDAIFDESITLKKRIIRSKAVYTGTDTIGDNYLHVCDSASAFTLTVPDGSIDGEEIRILNRGEGAVTLSGKLNITALPAGDSILYNWDVLDDEWQAATRVSLDV